MAAIKTDGTFTTATAVSPYRRVLPIAGDTTAQIIEQDFMIAYGSWSALALDTAHPTVTTAYLVEESAPSTIGNGLLQWTRRYATIPANRDEFSTFSYKLPGIWGTANPPYSQYWVSENDDGRDPYVDSIPSRIRYEYFLCATGQTYTTPTAIPILQGLEITLTTNANARMEYLLPEGQFVADSDPSREEWEALIAGGTGIGTGANAGEFIAEDSTIERYMGNIYYRATRYCKAK